MGICIYTFTTTNMCKPFWINLVTHSLLNAALPILLMASSLVEHPQLSSPEGRLRSSIYAQVRRSGTMLANHYSSIAKQTCICKGSGCGAASSECHWPTNFLFPISYKENCRVQSTSDEQTNVHRTNSMSLPWQTVRIARLSAIS